MDQLTGQFDFHSGNSPLKVLIQLLQVGPDGMMQRAVRDALADGLGGPGQDLVNRPSAMGETVLAEQPGEAIVAQFEDPGG